MTRLEQLISKISRAHVYIQMHNFPDPDAIASAFGLQELLKYRGIGATICYKGKIERYSTEKMCRLYAKYKEALAPYGVKTGVLVQASLGHGYKIVPNPFQKMVNPIDGSEYPICCPEDPDFLEHFTSVLKRIAAEHPSAIMLDDDFRIIIREKPGCACPRHMALFNEATGLSYTREQLYNHIITHPVDDEISVKYFEIQKNSLVKVT